ncbi:hypothetical protein B0H19DRAFT_660012 [Mycena capillaripes]|nr:hypothetical protein B0H19DRAFT_660012 [Mycena capillaripes]
MSEGMKTFQAPWSRLKRAISRAIRRRRFRAPSSLEHTDLTFSSHGTFSNPRDSSLDLVIPIFFDVPPADPDHNEKLGISRLPPELIADMFILLCEESRADLSDYSWIVCSHICSSWRHIALDTPHLWSHVVFSSPEWMRLCIQRSKSSLLIIEAGVTYPLVQSLVSEALQLTERIGRINLRFQFLSNKLLTQLAGPFPMLTSLSLENNSFWTSPLIPFDSDVPPYPRLRTLLIRTLVTWLPPLPAHLVSLEITSGGMEDIGWDNFAGALQPLVELEALTLQGFPLPLASASIRISLPKLRDLHLSAAPAHCVQFIRALESPHLRRYDLDLWNVRDMGEVFQAVLGNLKSSPTSMVLHRKYGGTSTSDYYRLPNYLDPGIYQHAVVGFAYTDARDLQDDLALDICFAWRIPLDDSELAAILVAVSEITLVDKIQWFLAIDWNTSPQGSWHRLLQRLVRLQTLVISHAPASGILWDLVRQLEGSVAIGETALCPELTEIEVNYVDCCAGAWIARRAHAQQIPVNSYVDLDGARFLEVLICYLELRPVKLPKLKVTRCFNYTVPEIKLLRRLVGQVLWDGVGAIGPSYGANGDEYGALTINHNLLSSRSGYEALNLSEEERWKRQNWAHWGFRSSKRLSDGPYHHAELDG